MTINIMDKLVSLIPTTAFDGKDVSKTILVDTNENPIFMANRAVLRTADKKIDVHGEDGLLAFSLGLDEFDDSTILESIASLNASVSDHDTAISQLTSDVAEAGTTANNAEALAETNKEDIVSVTTTANAADTLAKNNQSSIENMSVTMEANTAQIAANTRGIENNISAIADKVSQEDHDALVTTVGTKASQSDLNGVSETATAADTLSKANAAQLTDVEGAITDVEQEVATAKNLAESAQNDVDSLSDTVGNNTAQISTNTKNIGDNTAAIGTKASQSDLNTVSATATAADTLSKSNASAITGLNTAVDNNTSAIAGKASQSELNTVKNTANAADALSKSNEAKLAGKVSTDSDASVNSLHVKTGNYNSDENFDLKVNNSNVLSATASAMYAKKNIVMQNNSLIKSLGDAVDATDAMNKQSVELITNLLSGRIDSLADGAGDESDYVMVHEFSGLKFDNKTLDTYLTQYDNETQCHQMLNAIRKARPVKGGAVKWIMYCFLKGDHKFWDFMPPDVLNKEGVIRVVHDSDTAAKIEVTTVTENFYKLINFNFGTGNSGKRNDWQRFKARINGFNGFSTGQILTHDELDWEPTNNARTNMIRIRNAMPNGCMYICWHNPNSTDYKYRMVYHGTSSTMESTTGVCLIWKHGGDSSVGGIYINTASTDGVGWTRTYLGGSNGWAAFAKQDNRTAKTRFEGVDKLVVPFYEEPPELNLFVIASFNDDLLQLVAKDGDGDYESVGRYGVNWDGTWTRDEGYHTAFYRQQSNTYIAFNYLTFKWEKFIAAKQHTFVGQQAISNSLHQFAERSQFPVEGSVYVDFGDLDTLAYEQIAQPTIIHDNESNTSTIDFGAKRWGYVEGGGVPDTSGTYPEDGMDLIEEVEQ